MTTWILVIVLGYRGGVATAEFYSETSCTSARDKVMSMEVKYASFPNAICVKK